MGKERSILKALLTGTALGTVLGILFAPRPGEETRDQLRDWGEKAKDSMEKGDFNISERARKLRNEIENLTHHAIQSGQKRVQEEVEGMLKAVEEGRNILSREREEKPEKPEEPEVEPDEESSSEGLSMEAAEDLEEESSEEPEDEPPLEEPSMEAAEDLEESIEEPDLEEEPDLDSEESLEDFG